MILFHLERGDMMNQNKGSREGLDGRKMHVGMSTDIWHSNSPREVQFEGLWFGCACLCPLLRLGWGINSVIRSPEEQVLPDRMQKGRDQSLAQLLCFPAHQTSATPRPSLVQGPLLCASALPFSSQSLVPYFLNSFTPQHTSAAPAPRRLCRNLPALQHLCLSTSLHTRVSCRAQNGECRTWALSNEQLEASMMRDQEWSRMEQELRATTSRQMQREKL